MQKKCKVKIYGTVTRLVGSARMSVPPGIYTLEELSMHSYRLSGDGLPEFELDLREVATYMDRDMKVVEGRWP